SHNTRNGEDVAGGDRHQGTLTSKPFTVARRYINLLIGGGNHPGKTCVEVLVEDQVVRSVTGHNDNRLRPASIDVGDLQGKTAQTGAPAGGRGPGANRGDDPTVSGDKPPRPGPPEEQPDSASLSLALTAPRESNSATAALSSGNPPPGIFSTAEEKTAEATAPLGRKLVGALSRRAVLDPDQKVTITFAVAWYFPNSRVPGFDNGGRRYGRALPARPAPRPPPGRQP